MRQQGLKCAADLGSVQPGEIPAADGQIRQGQQPARLRQLVIRRLHPADLGGNLGACFPLLRLQF